MAYLMHIGFDNTRRLKKNVYLFEYKGIRFKLIQSKKKEWCDLLISLIKENNDRAEWIKVFAIAAEFLSCLSWENNSPIKLWHLGGMGVRDSFKLKQAKGNFKNHHRMPFSGNILGYGIDQIPKIETENQAIALSLYRDASSTNNNYLSFLFLWQILEISGDATGWVNKVYRRQRARLPITETEIDGLQLNGKKLGNYLYDDCRCAIAHLKPTRSTTVKKLDNLDDILRINISHNILHKFVKFFIEDYLDLKNTLLLKKGDWFYIYK